MPIPALAGDRPLLAPSILSADHARLGEEVRAVEAAGADLIHVDVMDGHFVPNLTLGPPIVTSLRKVTKLPFDVHLMIERPELSVQQYAEAGANIITVHAEATTHLHRTLGQIRELGVGVGVALNPATSLASIAYVLELVDLVLVMSVNPGFGGQRFIGAVVPKVAALAALIGERKLSTRISVDGGVDATTIPELRQAGASVFVSGSRVFGSQDYKATLAEMRNAAARVIPSLGEAPRLV